MVQAATWVKAANIHVTSNSANYGDVNSQDATAATNSVITFEDFNLADLFFKNTAAGSNTVITAICDLATEKYKTDFLGVI